MELASGCQVTQWWGRPLHAFSVMAQNGRELRYASPWPGQWKRTSVTRSCSHTVWSQDRSFWKDSVCVLKRGEAVAWGREFGRHPLNPAGPLLGGPLSTFVLSSGGGFRPYKPRLGTWPRELAVLLSSWSKIKTAGQGAGVSAGASGGVKARFSCWRCLWL